MIGNEQIKKQINMALSSAKQRNTSLPHMLFSGAPGCGKTTLAKEIAHIGGMDYIQTAPDSLSTYKSVVDLLADVNHEGYNPQGDIIDTIRPTIIFIDEIHRMPRAGQELIGIVMENFQLESDKDSSKYIWFPLFTVIGATTEEGLLTKPLRDRFLNFPFKLYEDDTMAEIVIYHAKRMGLMITLNAAYDIAVRSRGTPRIAVNYLNRVRDYSIFIKKDLIDNNVTQGAFEELGIDKLGLNENERTLMLSLYEINAPVGINNLSVNINVSPKTLSDSIEPFLVNKGLIARSGKGRILTPKGRHYVQVEILEAQEKVFKKEIEAGHQRKL